MGINVFATHIGVWLQRACRTSGQRALLVVAGVFTVWLCWPLRLFDAQYSIVVEDRDGRLLGAVIAEDEQWRFPPDGLVPEKFVQAITVMEDRRFFWHPGVDPAAVLRAVWSNLRAGRVVRGASTLTMQVIRLSRRDRPRSIIEKAIETALALRLDLRRSKEEILALYAAHAPFGGNVVGLEAASWRYFGRPPDRLSWAETAMLAVLPNNPALIHPGRNRDLLLAKRNRLLNRLWQQGTLDSLTCALATLEPLPPAPYPIPQYAPHVLTRLRKTLPAKSVHTRLRTTIQLDIQTEAKRILSRHHDMLARNGIYNAAALIVEVNSGQVAAYIGNVEGVDHSNYVDIVTAPRSTGSLLKPLLYAGMLESGALLPSMLVPDIPLRIGGFAPQNFGDAFRGAVPASMALARSLNVPAVHMLYTYSVDRFINLLNQFGMTTLHRRADDYGLSLIIGGGEGSLWDLTGIYASLGRQLNAYGKDRQPLSFFAPILAPGIEPDPTPRRSPVSAGTAWLTLTAMQEVTRPDVESAWQWFTSSQAVAWKTGTSQGFRDAWAIGVTPAYAVGVWVGNADGEGRPGLVGVQVAAPILFELFGLLDTGGWFVCPQDDLEDIEVCAKSGFRPGPHCAATKQEAVPHAGLKTSRCPYCTLVHCDTAMAYRVHSDCERVAAMKAVRWFVLPPAMEWYYMRSSADYRALPPYREDCLETMARARTPSMSIVYPTDTSHIYVPVELDGQEGRVVFVVAHRDPETAIYWHLDENYLGSTRNLHQMALAPVPGAHRLTLVDVDGERLEREFTILGRE
jgi:penicillin-binding protein 1C